MQRPKRLSVEWLVENNMPIYVKNMTRPRGQVVLTITLPDGKNKALKIPKTFIPVCLSEYAPKEVLLRCYDLAQYIMKGILELQDPAEAQRELSTEDSAEEMRKLQLSEYSSLSKWASKSQEPEQPQLEEGDDFGVDEDPIQAISPRVMQLVESYRGNDLSPKELLNELKIIETDLTEVDCSYVIQNGPSGQVREFVQKVLARTQDGSSQSSLPNVSTDSDVDEDKDLPEAKKIALDDAEERMKAK